MNDRKLWMLYAAFAVVVAGLSIWQIRSYYASFEPVQPYTHPGPAAAERTLPEETSEAQQETTDHRRTKAEATSETARSTEAETDEPTQATEETAVVFPVDLNTADAETLQQIPGIGEVTAAAIISYREAHGGFRNREELLQVHGIGEGRYHEMLGYIYLEHEEPLPSPDSDEPPADAAVQTPPEEPEQPQEPESPQELSVINLNTASKEQLMQLPGCSGELADSILHLREEIHEIRSTMELYMVQGMTESLYHAWEPYLAVDDDGNQTFEEAEP
ncbi:MAG: helix-hairpin-helix domain-containing protein [Oscillospiraceae bacterium]|nr:helix-hairpin-helix domain-containing protein [Oscillospiraceae bacterium]